MKVKIIDGWDGHKGDIIDIKRGTLLFRDMVDAPIGHKVSCTMDGITYEKLTD